MAKLKAPGEVGSSATNQALNALRFVAALTVVVGHARDYFLEQRPSSAGPINTALYAATSLAHPAVIVFFVLSGYFVGGAVLTSRNSFDVRRYTVNRLVRLWLVLLPALTLTFVLDGLARRLWPTSAHYSAGGQVDQATSWGAALGNAVFMQAGAPGEHWPLWGPRVVAFGSNGALWSIGYEALYYALFPALVLLWLGRRRLLAGGVAAGLCIIAGPDILSLFPIWLLGAVVAARRGALATRLNGWTPSTVALVRVGLVAMLLLASVAQRFTPALLGAYTVGILSAALVATLVTDVRPRRRWLAGTLFAGSWAAEFSYSLYATHLPIVSFAAVATNPDHQVRPWLASPAGWAGMIPILAALIAVAWVAARYTEMRTATVRRWVLREPLLSAR